MYDCLYLSVWLRLSLSLPIPPTLLLCFSLSVSLAPFHTFTRSPLHLFTLFTVLTLLHLFTCSPFPFFYNSEFQLWADFSWEFLEVVLLPLLLIPTESYLENMMPRIAMILCQQWSTAHLYGGVEEKLDHHSDVTNITWLTYSNANGPWSQHNSLCTGFRFFDNCNFLSWKVEKNSSCIKILQSWSWHTSYFSYLVFAASSL